jgi:hypothetical protein
MTSTEHLTDFWAREFDRMEEAQRALSDEQWAATIAAAGVLLPVIDAAIAEPTPELRVERLQMSGALSPEPRKASGLIRGVLVGVALIALFVALWVATPQ